MSRPLSQATRDAFFSPEMDDVVLLLLTIDEASLDEPIRVVHNNESVTSRGDLFVPFVFGIDLPEETGRAPSPVRIQIDAVDQQIVRAIREAVGQPRVVLEIVLASDPDLVEAGPWVFRLESAEYNESSVTGEVSIDGIENIRSSNYSFSPELFPNLF